MRLYYCLKYYKTVHSLSVFMDSVPNEVLYVLTRALREKVAFVNQSIKNLDPHSYHWKQRYDTVSRVLITVLLWRENFVDMENSWLVF